MEGGMHFGISQGKWKLEYGSWPGLVMDILWNYPLSLLRHDVAADWVSTVTFPIVVTCEMHFLIVHFFVTDYLDFANALCDPIAYHQEEKRDSNSWMPC